jgi:hypothetical protein
MADIFTNLAGYSLFEFLNFPTDNRISFMFRYYDSFVIWNRKASTLDIFARPLKTDVALLCVGPKSKVRTVNFVHISYY